MTAPVTRLHPLAARRRFVLLCGAGVAAVQFAAAPAARCRLIVSPAEVRPRDTAHIRWDLSGIPFPLVAGHTRFEQEAMGRSLRLTSADGLARRFQPMPMHLLGSYPVDTVRHGRLGYRLTFPNGVLGLVAASAWSDRWLNPDSTPGTSFTWPPGDITLRATLTLYAAPRSGDPRSLAALAPPTDSLILTCRPATLRVRP